MSLEAPDTQSSAEPKPTPTELFALFTSQQRAGDLEGALETALQITRLYPGKSSGFFQAAQCLIQLGRLAEAMEIADQGLKIHPMDDKLHRTKLGLHMRCRHSAVVDDYSKRLLHPDAQDVSIGMLFDLAGYEMSRWNFEAAAAAAARVVKSGGARVSAYLGLAQALLNLNKPQEAMDVVEDALDAYPDEPKLYRAAEGIQVQLSRTARALDYARKWVAFDPSNEKAQHAVYLHLVTLGRFDEAEKQLSEAHRCSAKFNFWKSSHHFRQRQRMRDEFPPVAEAWEAGLANRIGAPDVSAGAAAAVPVIQYWSQGEPPTDLKVVIGTWNSVLEAQGLGPALVYDKDSARRWIAEHAPEFTAPFNQAFHFAMESDIFRIAYASRVDCIYIDIDSWPLAGLSQVLGYGLQSGSSMLYFRAGQPSLNNSFFIARRNCPFFGELVRQCSRIDLSELPHERSTILSTFGPGRFNAVLHEIVGHGAVESVQPVTQANGVSAMRFRSGASLLFCNEFATAAQKPPYPLVYKSTDDYWKAVPRSA